MREIFFPVKHRVESIVAQKAEILIAGISVHVAATFVKGKVLQTAVHLHSLCEVSLRSKSEVQIQKSQNRSKEPWH